MCKHLRSLTQPALHQQARPFVLLSVTPDNGSSGTNSGERITDGDALFHRPDHDEGTCSVAFRGLLDGSYLRDGLENRLPEAEITKAGPAASLGKSVAYGGLAKPDLSKRAASLTAILAKSSIPFSLRVSLPEAGAINASPMGQEGWAAVKSLMATAVQGRQLPVDWVDPGSKGADLHLTIKGSRLFILPASGALISVPGFAPSGFAGAGPASTGACPGVAAGEARVI